jgi:pilus assembly protein TadC
MMSYLFTGFSCAIVTIIILSQIYKEEKLDDHFIAVIAFCVFCLWPLVIIYLFILLTTIMIKKYMKGVKIKW